MSFHVGQKVVCVDDKIDWLARLLRWALKYPWLLRKGEIYTVAAISAHDGERILTLVEVKNPPLPDDAYRASRFRPIVERKTDISLFTAMLDTTKRSVDA